MPSSKREVAEPRGDERLLRRCRRAGFVIPEADQQVGSQADNLPADEQQQQAVGDDQPEHGGGEQREETEEAREILVVRHVAEAVDEDEQANQRDHHQHDRREGVEHPAEPERSATQLRIAGLEPEEVDHLPRGRAVPRMLKRVDKRHARQGQRENHRANRQQRREPALALFEQRAQPRGPERQRGNQPKMLNNPIHLSPSSNRTGPNRLSGNAGRSR